MNQQTAQNLVQQLRNSGGFTFNPTTREAPKTGYAVSRYGHEVRLIPGQLSPEFLRAYVNQRRKLFDDAPAACIGGWHDPETGLYYLDVTDILQFRATAIAAGRANRQRTIYCLDSGETINVNLAQGWNAV